MHESPQITPAESLLPQWILRGDTLLIDHKPTRKEKPIQCDDQDHRRQPRPRRAKGKVRRHRHRRDDHQRANRAAPPLARWVRLPRKLLIALVMTCFARQQLNPSHRSIFQRNLADSSGKPRPLQRGPVQAAMSIGPPPSPRQIHVALNQTGDLRHQSRLTGSKETIERCERRSIARLPGAMRCPGEAGIAPSADQPSIAI